MWIRLWQGPLSSQVLCSTFHSGQGLDADQLRWKDEDSLGLEDLGVCWKYSSWWVHGIEGEVNTGKTCAAGEGALPRVLSSAPSVSCDSVCALGVSQGSSQEAGPWCPSCVLDAPLLPNFSHSKANTHVAPPCSTKYELRRRGPATELGSTSCVSGFWAADPHINMLVSRGMGNATGRKEPVTCSVFRCLLCSVSLDVHKSSEFQR